MIQMTISYVYKKITEIMQALENINLYEMSTSSVRRYNQKKIHYAYKQLDNLKAELEREYIKNKQKRNKK